MQDLATLVGPVQTTGRLVYLVTLPPVVLPEPLPPVDVTPYNEALTASFVPFTVIDGTTGMSFREDGDLGDYIHLDDDSQQLIAERIVARLQPAPGPWPG